jgi:hypothetical protein
MNTIDNSFIIDFIQQCAAENKTSTQDICVEALKQIDIIDEQIKKRAKLHSVLKHFKYKKNKQIKDVVINSNYDPGNRNFIIELFKDNNTLLYSNFITAISNLDSKLKRNIIFTYKQLVENGHLKVSGDIIENIKS